MNMNMADLFGKMMEMQQKLAEIQETVRQKQVTVEAGGGMVQVTANGAREIIAIKIEPEAVNPEERELLEDLVVAGVNKALAEAERLAQEEMSKMAGSLLPPGMNLGQFGL